MTYISESFRQQNVAETEIPRLIDPVLLRASREIYRKYALHRKVNKRPLGVAIDKETHRGQLIFKNRIILLPGECFVSLKQIESEMY